MGETININRTTALELTAAQATGGLNTFYWYQIFAIIVSAVVEAQAVLSLQGDFLTRLRIPVVWSVSLFFANWKVSCLNLLQALFLCPS